MLKTEQHNFPPLFECINNEKDPRNFELLTCFDCSFGEIASGSLPEPPQALPPGD